MLTFDRFTFDPARGRLLRDGRLVRVQPQTLRLLEALTQADGAIVTREALRAALWPTGTHVEFDTGLNTAMRKLRRALGEAAGAPRFIQTVPGIGYRFIAPVAPVEPVASVVPVVRLARGTGEAEAVTTAPSPVRPSTAVAAAPPGATPAWRQYRNLAALVALILILASAGGPPALAESAFIDDACALHRAKQPALALRTIERGLVVHPHSAVLRAHRGLYLHAVGRYDEEIGDLRQAVRQAPRSPEVHYQLGLGLARRAQYDESLAALDRAVALSNGEPRYLSWLGRIAADAGRRTEAEAVLAALRLQAAGAPVAPELIDAVAYHLAHAKG